MQSHWELYPHPLVVFGQQSLRSRVSGPLGASLPHHSAPSWAASGPRQHGVVSVVLGTGRAVRLSLPFPQVMHPALRPVAPNPCVARGCSHLCLLSARHAGQCRCPARLILAADETTCLPLRDSAFALLVSPAAVAQVLSS